MKRLIYFLLSILGFGAVSCDGSNDVCMYGVPTAKYVVNARVVDPEGNPIKGIEVVVSEGEDFEDVIRTAVSLGGDCDTLTAIAGSIAEGFYGVPDDWKQQCRRYLPQEFLDILDQIDKHRKSVLPRFETKNHVTSLNHQNRSTATNRPIP